jgi:hypothetical protein
MCGSSQNDIKSKVCTFCDYEEKRIEELSKEEFYDLMSPYEYEMTEDGVRINSVKSGRNLALRGAVGIPHFVTEIASYAFAGCKFLSRIGLPNGLRSIGEGAFANCRDLFDVLIPESVTYIGKGAFADCYDLGVICSAVAIQPDGWDKEWLLGCSAKVEWNSVDEM